MRARKPKQKILEPPEHLDRDQRSIWIEKATELAAQGMTPADIDAGLLEFYAVSMCTARQAQKQVAKGLIVSSKKDEKGKPDTQYAQENPYLPIAKKAYADALKTEAALMKKAAAKNGSQAAQETPGVLVTRRELAERLDVHMQSVTVWERAGMPIAERGRKGKPSLYSEADARKWIADREEGARENGSYDLVRERARKERAQAILAEQTVAIRAGDLLPRDQVEKTWMAEVSAVRAKLLSWPTTISDAVFREATLHGLQGVERVIKAAVEELLLELSKPKRVTTPRRVKKRAKKAKRVRKAKKGGRRKK